MKRSAWMMLVLTPLLGGAEGECGGNTFNMDPAPDMSGDWSVSYEDDLRLTIELGGAVYDQTLGAAGGTVTIDHDGQPIEFNLDCSLDAVVCPSEVWETDFAVRQDNEEFPHRVWLSVPQSECMGTLVDADPMECGAGTQNPDCNQVCDGETTAVRREAYGEINGAGDAFTFLLGAGIASNGVNCVLLGGSIANGDLATTGSAETEDWLVESVPTGEVITEYTGGCLWAGDPDMDEELEALVIGARVRFATSYSAARR